MYKKQGVSKMKKPLEHFKDIETPILSQDDVRLVREVNRQLDRGSVIFAINLLLNHILEGDTINRGKLILVKRELNKQPTDFQKVLGSIYLKRK